MYTDLLSVETEDQAEILDEQKIKLPPVSERDEAIELWEERRPHCRSPRVTWYCREILAVLAERGSGQPAQYMADWTETPVHRARRALNRLQDLRLAYRDPQGKWFATPLGIEAIIGWIRQLGAHNGEQVGTGVSGDSNKNTQCPPVCPGTCEFFRAVREVREHMRAWGWTHKQIQQAFRRHTVAHLYSRVSWIHVNRTAGGGAIENPGGYANVELLQGRDPTRRRERRIDGMVRQLELAGIGHVGDDFRAVVKTATIEHALWTGRLLRSAARRGFLVDGGEVTRCFDYAMREEVRIRETSGQMRYHRDLKRCPECKEHWGNGQRCSCRRATA